MTDRPSIGAALRTVLATAALLQPLARPLLRRRLRRGKEDPDRWREKLGEASLPRPDGPLVWLHGVGVGEVMALRGLIASLAEARPEVQFLVTSSARSSAGVFAKNAPPRTHHQYLPLDFPAFVTRFLDHWQPDLVVWSDQEVWPRLAVQAARRGIPQAYVAARITDRSARSKAGFGTAYGDLYRLLDLRHAQDAGTAAHLAALMGDDTPVRVTGSLKAAAAPLADDADLRAALPPRDRVWLAASAHRADIDVALGAVSDDHLLIIAPRDLEDAEEVQTRCAAMGLAEQRRSTGGWPDAATRVFIADSFGELGIWYRASFAALIGGTFDNTEGHNPWEAVALGCAVMHGPRVANFSSDFRALEDAGAARLVTSARDLAAALADPDLGRMAMRATEVRADAADGLDRITNDLLALLDR